MNPDDLAKQYATPEFQWILAWLDPNEEHRNETLNLLGRLVPPYAQALESPPNSWKESTQQLQKLAHRTETLHSTLVALSAETRVLWNHAETEMGIPNPGKDIFQCLYLDRLPTLADYRLTQDQGWVCTKPSDLPAITPPAIETPMQELGERLTAVLAWIRENRGKTGRGNVTHLTMGSPETELLAEARKGLHQLGLDPQKAYELGRRIHQLLTGTTPTRHWAKEADRRTRAWFEATAPWLGREDEAPPDIRRLIQQGCKAITPRRRPRKR
jgi:hypothetical protein